MSPYFGSNQSRYNTPIGVNASDSRGGNFPNSASRNVWGNGNGGHNNSANNAGSTSYFGLVSGGFGVFGNNGANWGTSPIRSSSGYGGGNFGNRGRENSYGLEMGGGFGRSNTAGAAATASSFSASGGDFVGSYPDIYGSGSVYGDPTWQNTSSELDNSGTFGYGPGNSEDVAAKYSENYVVGYGIVNRQPSRAKRVMSVTDVNISKHGSLLLIYDVRDIEKYVHHVHHLSRGNSGITLAF